MDLLEAAIPSAAIPFPFPIDQEGPRKRFSGRGEDHASQKLEAVRDPGLPEYARDVVLDGVGGDEEPFGGAPSTV